jgi:hypothetical protein
MPVLTNCGANRTIAERSALNTAVVGPALAATVDNVGTALLFSINNVGPIPFTVGSCNGIISLAQTPLLYQTQSSYTLQIAVQNVGLQPSLTATCNVVVNVVRVPLPPTLATTVLYVKELSTAGSLVGNLGPAASLGDSLGPVTIANQTVAGAFTIDAYGNVLVGAKDLPSIALQSQYTLNVSAADTLGIAAYIPVTINVLAVPQPPTTYPQTLYVQETAAPGSILPGGPLNATSNQLLNLTFVALSPSNTFGIYSNGSLYIQPAVSLNYALQPTFILQFTVADSNGKSTTSSVTVNLIQVVRPPVFCCGNIWSLNVIDGVCGDDAF